jgi:hypothetical protein
VLAENLHCALVHWQALSRQLRGLTVLRENQMFWWFFVSLNESASGRFNGETNFREQKGADRGERCAASRAFNGSSPTANLVSNIKVQGMS